MIILTVLACYPYSRAVAVFAENSIRFDHHFRSHAESVALREGEGGEGVNRGSLFAAGFRCILRSGGATLNFPKDGQTDRRGGRSCLVGVLESAAEGSKKSGVANHEVSVDLIQLPDLGVPDRFKPLALATVSSGS